MTAENPFVLLFLTLTRFLASIIFAWKESANGELIPTRGVANVHVNHIHFGLHHASRVNPLPLS